MSLMLFLAFTFQMQAVPAVEAAVKPPEPQILDLIDSAKQIAAKTHVHPVTEKVWVTPKKRNPKDKPSPRAIQRVIGKEVIRITLAPGNDFREVLIRIRFPDHKGGDPTVLGVEPSYCSAEYVSGGGVNANYRILCNGQEEIVLAGNNLLDSGEQAVYAPYSDNLVRPEVILAGENHNRGNIARAESELRRDLVRSRAVPGKLVADVIPDKIVFSLSLIEHIDHEEYRDRGPLYAGNKVLVQLGINQKDTFRYAYSSAGAMCLMQIMSWTYKEVRIGFPEARLPQSAFVGSCGDEVTAIKVAYLVLDSKLSEMPEDFREKFARDPDTYGVYLAAAYNGGQGAAKNLYNSLRYPQLLETLSDLFGQKFLGKPHRKYLGAYPETWIFIKKYDGVAIFAVQPKAKEN